MTRKLSVLSRVSSMAIAAMLTAGAAAQSFQGTPTVTTGDVIISEGSGITNVNVNSVQSIIDWTPDDNASGNLGAINFQPTGTTATFTGTSDFAVLNRVNVADPGRVVAMSGTINSLVNGQTGGSIFFYSPSGFVIGSSAVINVGSLVLTASPLAVDGNGNFLQGTTATFNQAPNPNAAITTVAGSQINANGAGSYVALVAPQINHHGTIRTDNAAALVAAEAATINFSPDGLFDIQVTVGTDDPNGVNVDGGTIARNSATEGVGNHHAYLVAVAKNDAVTMLVQNGGSVGFDTATSAAVEDNVVILAAGHDVNSGSAYVPSGTSPVGLTIDNAAFSTDTFATVSGGANITTSTGSTAFGNNLTLNAGDDSFIQAINGNSLAIGGSLYANVDKYGGFGNASVTGNFLRLAAYGSSSVTVSGDVYLSANAYAFSDSEGFPAGDAVGGTTIVQTGGNSSISVGGLLDMRADGQGGDAFSSGVAGSGTGGTGQILANGGNSSIFIAGDTSVSAQGYGGSTGECSVCMVTGGNGAGGQILVDNLGGSGNSLTFGNGDPGGDLTLDANGFGGAGDVGAGTGAGGVVQLTSGDASSILIRSDLVINAYGDGGYGFDATGGNATGGNVSITFSGAPSTIDVVGQALLDASGSGGFGTAGGGDATGGFVNVQASSGGTLNIPTLFASAGGFGGDGDVGGDGIGGRAWVQAITSGTINLDFVNLVARGQGGSGFVGAGGNGTGGYVVASADAATLNAVGNLSLNADGDGGSTSGSIAPGGTGQGGQADVFADHGGLANLDGLVSAEANGEGGGGFDLTSQAGDGIGGQVFFQASNGATMDAAGDVYLAAEGYGGFTGGECVGCGGAGGNGTGGTVTAQVYGGTGTVIGVGGDLELSANGYGADGYGGNGGSGTGGSARVYLNQDGGIDVTGGLNVHSVGEGGWQTNGLNAGNGTGGTAEISFDASNAVLSVGGLGSVDATGNGGSVSGGGGTGGSALGGVARVYTAGGSANFVGDLNLYSNASGGSAAGGTGGDARSGMTRVAADGGTISIGANLSLESISAGGDGDNGGDAIAFIGNDPRNTATSDARVVAGNGSITVTGLTTLDVHSQGGNGANGGAGGDAAGGYATVHALNRDAGDGFVNLADLLIDAEATGGDGGAGVNGNSGGDGGSGGTATGGFVAVTASAGNGHLSIGDVDISVSAFGGSGGDGGNGDGSSGGNGGNGGTALGGFTNNGTESGNPEALGVNNGTADFASLTAIASATGGNGGNGNSGATNGLAGNGGDAVGGNSVLLVRGSTVTVGDVLLDSSATGGNGGLSPTAPNGDGGDATTGTIRAIVTNRAGLPAQRGTLFAGNIVGTTTATGGSGGLGNGLSLLSGANRIQFANSNATIDSLSFTSNALGLAAGYTPDSIAVTNGDVLVLGTFDFTTSGQLSLFADNGTQSSNLLQLTAADFVYDTVNGPPLFAGTYFANSAAISTGNNFLTDANLNIDNDFSLIAPGSIATGIFTTAGLLDLWGQSGSVHVERVNAGTSVSLLAGTFVDTGDIDAGAGVTITAQGGSINIGNVTAGGDVSLSANSFINGDAITTTGAVFAQTASGDLGLNTLQSGTGISLISGSTINLTGDASAATDISLDATDAIAALNLTATGGSITAISANGGITAGDLLALTIIDLHAPAYIAFGNAQADELHFDSGGAVNGGNIVAGTEVKGDGGGAIVLGDISVGILLAGGAAEKGAAVGIGSATSISVGNVEADEAIGFATAGSLTAGDLNSGTDVLTMVGGDTNIASIITPGTGRTYLTDVQMFVDAGGPNNFDPSLVFPLTPLRSSGAITITGPVSTGNFQAAAASITTGNVSAPVGIYLDSANGISTGDLAAANGDVIAQSGGDMSLANVTAGNDVLLDSGAGVSLGNVTAQAGSVQATAANVMSFLSITAGTFVTLDPTLITGGDISALAGDVNLTGDAIDIGNVSASDNVVLTALAGDLSTLAITAGLDVTLDATGNVTTGDIAASGLIDAIGASLTLGNLSANSIDLTTTVADLTVGNITIPGNLALTTAGDLVFGNLSAFDVDLAATASMTGGNINSLTDITAQAGTSVSLGNLVAGGTVSATGRSLALGDVSASVLNLTSTVGDVSTGDLFAFSSLTVDSAADFLFGSITAPLVDLTAPGSIIGGFIDSNTDITAAAGAGIDVGDLTAGGFDGEVVQLGDILLTAGGAISTGMATAEGFVSATAGGGIATGAIDAADFVFLKGSSVATGNVDAGSSIEIDAITGNVTVGNLLAPNAISLTATGAVASGNISGGTVGLTAGSSLSGGAINAQSINGHAGGLATINGLWQAPNVELWSNDIDISANGGIDAGNSGLIRLVSTNATQALIGDGLTGTGYQLSNAEFGRLSSGSVQIGARGDASAAIDMLIGDLTITGPTAGSTIDDPLGSVAFATGDPLTEIAGGVIRVVGDVNAAGFTADNALQFTTGRFELDAATGSINILGSGTTLSGQLKIEADRIHVASGTILDQLAADPHYAGYQDDINAPAAVQRPEGVVRAGSIIVAPTQALLVQNTGTADQRAGFTANFVDVIPPAGAAPGSIELIANGQLLGEAGTLFGVAVRDAVVPHLDLALFTEGSMINGCLLTGACGVIVPPEPPFPPGFTPTPDIQDEFVLLGDDPLPPPEFGNENFIDDNDEVTEEGKTSPIEPPMPLFDTSALDEADGTMGPEAGTPMRSNPGLNDSGDIDDPVSGGGNPGLMTVPPPTGKQEKQP